MKANATWPKRRPGFKLFLLLFWEQLNFVKRDDNRETIP